MDYAHLFGLEQNLEARISASIPTAILIAISTGPYLTGLARLLHTELYCRPREG